MNNTYVTAALVAFLIAYILYQEISKRTTAIRQYRAKREAGRLELYLSSIEATRSNTEAIDKLSFAMDSLLRIGMDEFRMLLAATQKAADTASINTESTDKLRASFEASLQSGADATALLAGTLKACEAIAASTTDLRQEVGAFAKLLTGGSTADTQREEAARELSADEHEGAAATFANILRGIPLDRAAQIERDLLEKKTMMSATGLLEDE